MLLFEGILANLSLLPSMVADVSILVCSLADVR